MITKRDWLVFAGLFLGALALYSVFAVQIAASPFFDYFNLAFDTDPRRYAETIARAPQDRHPGSSVGGIKHPLLFYFQIIGTPLRWATGDWKLAAALTSSAAGAMAMALTYLFFRINGAATSLAALATCLFAVSAAPLLNAFISDSYIYALMTIALAWVIGSVRLYKPHTLKIASIAAAALSFGVTVTNAAQNALAEAAALKNEHGWKITIRRTVFYSALVTLTVMALLILTFPSTMWWIATHPIESLKLLYWQQTKGESTGLLQVIISFFVFGFTAPNFTTVLLPGDAPMLDFRAWSFNALGTANVVTLSLLLVFGFAIAAFEKTQRKWLYLGLFMAICFNMLIHGRYQFRGSVFLYAPHIVFNIFAFVLPALLWVQSRGKMAVYAGCASLALLVGTTAWVNLPRAWELSTTFQGFVVKPEWLKAYDALPVQAENTDAF